MVGQIGDDRGSSGLSTVFFGLGLHGPGGVLADRADDGQGGLGVAVAVAVDVPDLLLSQFERDDPEVLAPLLLLASQLGEELGRFLDQNRGIDPDLECRGSSGALLVFVAGMVR